MGKLHEAGLDIGKFGEANLLRTLELSLQFGKWLLLEHVADLDPAMDPVRPPPPRSGP